MSNNLSNTIQTVVASVLENMHTCIPGEIIKYDFSKQRAQVRPLIKKAYNDGTEESQPIIVNVPVVWPRGTNSMLHMPLNSGDTVMIYFSERSLEVWLDRGGEASPGEERKFDLTDAVAIPGVYPFNVPSLATNNDDVVLIHGGSKLTLKKNGDIDIDSAGDVTINGGNIDLGDGATRKLMTDAIISKFNAHTHVYIPGTLATVVTSTPAPAFSSADATSKTEAE